MQFENFTNCLQIALGTRRFQKRLKFSYIPDTLLTYSDAWVWSEGHVSRLSKLKIKFIMSEKVITVLNKPPCHEYTFL
jgi:hypothetical protein